MKKNGYTLIELLVLIGVMGVAVFIILSKTSYAFKDNTDELHKSEINLILRQAKEYGKSLEELKDEKEMIIMVADLVENSYLAASEDGNVYDINGEKINDLKIKIIYDEEDEEVSAVLIN